MASTPKKTVQVRKHIDTPIPKTKPALKKPPGRSDVVARGPGVDPKNLQGPVNKVNPQMERIEEDLADDRALTRTLHAASAASSAADRREDLEDDLADCRKELGKGKESERALRAAFSKAGTEGLKAMTDALEKTVENLTGGYQALKSLEKKQMNGLQKEDRLKKKLLALEKKANLQTGYLRPLSKVKYGTDPSVELQKFQHDGKYIPCFPEGHPRDWDNLAEWTVLLRKFLEVVRNRLCPPAEWPKDLGKWKEGKYSTQSMLHNYLAPYLASGDMKLCVAMLGEASTKIVDAKWDSFIRSIDDLSHELFSTHYASAVGFGTGSHHFFFYLGIIRSFCLENPTGNDGNQGVSEPTAAETVDATSEVAISIPEDLLPTMYQSLWDELTIQFELLGVNTRGVASRPSESEAMTPTNSTGTAPPACAGQSTTRMTRNAKRSELSE